MSVKAALLQALIKGEAYGLEVIERVDEATGGNLLLAQGRVYPALRELERDGFVTSREGDPIPERGGRPRIFYELTAEGKRAAAENAKTISSLFGLRLKPGLQ